MHWSDEIDTSCMFATYGCRAYKRLCDAIQVPWDTNIRLYDRSTWYLTMETDSAIEHECYNHDSDAEWETILERYGEYLLGKPSHQGHLVIDVHKHVLAEREYHMRSRDGHYTCVAACDKVVIPFLVDKDKCRLVFEDPYQVRTIEDEAHWVTYYDANMAMTQAGKETVHKVANQIKSMLPDDWEMIMPKD